MPLLLLLSFITPRGSKAVQTYTIKGIKGIVCELGRHRRVAMPVATRRVAVAVAGWRGPREAVRLGACSAVQDGSWPGVADAPSHARCLIADKLRAIHRQLDYYQCV